MVYPIAKLIFPPIYKLWLRKVQGIENVPMDKTFIIAANHASFYDGALLPSIIIPKINKKIHALVKSNYWKNPLIGILLDFGGGIPVHVGSNAAKNTNKGAFNKATGYIRNNEIIQIFPEGTRSHDGKLKKAYNGAALLALKTKAPVLPIGIIGSNKVLPAGKIFLRFARCEVNIGRLMYFEKYYNKKIDKKILENTTRTIMKEIAKLSKQEYNF